VAHGWAKPNQINTLSSFTAKANRIKVVKSPKNLFDGSRKKITKKQRKFSVGEPTF
jgi:hypothetical protein